MRLAEVRLLVDRFEECVRFYEDVMGLRLRVRVPGDVYAAFEGGGVELGLYQRRLMNQLTGAEDRPGPRKDYTALAFLVEDVDSTFAALRDRGAEAVTEPHDQEAWEIRVAHLRDPEGNLIEIAQRSR